ETGPNGSKYKARDVNTGLASWPLRRLTSIRLPPGCRCPAIHTTVPAGTALPPTGPSVQPTPLPGSPLPTTRFPYGSDGAHSSLGNEHSPAVFPEPISVL